MVKKFLLVFLLAWAGTIVYMQHRPLDVLKRNIESQFFYKAFPEQLTTNARQMDLKYLKYMAYIFGATVTEVELREGLNGLTWYEERAIQLNNKLSIDAKVEVLSHELGHLLQPPNLGEGAESEVFAESVAFLVQRCMGFKHDRSVAYLGNYKQASYIIDAYRAEIEWAAYVIAGGC